MRVHFSTTDRNAKAAKLAKTKPSFAGFASFAFNVVTP